ncbi:MAG TPA: DUF6455 family protein [Roseiarcus sp.]|nr:DUF6455 family protein [Roseiarcus sp.]
MSYERRSKGLFRQVVEWWRSAVREPLEFESLDPSEREHIAREFGLSGRDLAKVNRGGPRSAELLRGMMRANGLSFAELREAHPDVLPDLEIHCSLCLAKGRCLRELASGAAPEGFADYCPNAATFVELQAENLLRLN